MSKLKYFLLFSLLIGSMGSLKSQNFVSGLVIDEETGLPISYVQIIERKNKEATISDSLGRFSIDIKGFPTILNFSHLSYELKNSLLRKDPQRTLQIPLTPGLVKIEEVFILGDKLQHFFKKDLFSIKDYVITNNRVWTLGYSNNNSLDMEIRVLKLSGGQIAKKKVRKGTNLFLDAYKNVHQVNKDSVLQLFILNDKISTLASITNKEEREIFLNLVANIDSLAILKKVNPIGTYNEYYAFNFKDSSKTIFHKAYDHDLFETPKMALRYTHQEIPDIIFPPFGMSMNWDPSDGFTRNSEDRLLIYKKIKSQLFIYNDTIVVYQDCNPQFTLYDKGLNFLGTSSLELEEGGILNQINKEKPQALQQDKRTGQVFIFTNIKGRLFISIIDPIKGVKIKTTEENGLRFVSNVKVYNNRIYFLKQVPSGYNTIDLFSIPFE